MTTTGRGRSTAGYRVKELFFTLQGEGRNAGRAAVFCRFSGCNLWSGREEDRHKGPSCSRWCDTDFRGTDGTDGGTYPTVEALGDVIRAKWPGGGRALVVFTGGEPLLQLDEPLIAAVHGAGFEIAVETNGTIAPPPGIDWLTVSPKAGTELVTTSGNELKLVFPQNGAEPDRFERLAFEHFYLQPLDGPDAAECTRRAVAYCLAHPHWRLSVQVHKVVGIR